MPWRVWHGMVADPAAGLRRKVSAGRQPRRGSALADGRVSLAVGGYMEWAS